MSIGKLATALTVSFTVTVAFLIVELLFILRRRRLKARTRVEPTEAPTETQNESSPEDPVVDIFKLLEANGPSRFLCTIKEDDGECVESRTSISGVDCGEKTEKVSLKAFLESEAAEEKEKAVKVTVVSSPYDSPVFFTPVGSPARLD